MAIAKVFDEMGAEVVSKNLPRGYVNLELDTGERALLPVSLMRGNSDVERRQRLARLQEESQIRVIVVEDKSGDTPFFIVSECIERHRPQVEAAPTSSNTDLALRFPRGRMLRGRPRRNGNGFNIAVDGMTVFLPLSHLGTTNPASLKPNVDVKVYVHGVSDGRVIVGKNAPEAAI